MAKAASGRNLSAAALEAWKLYEGGDVASARSQAHKVLAAPEAAEDEEQMRALLERTRFPRVALSYGAVAAALIAFMIVLALLRT